MFHLEPTPLSLNKKKKKKHINKNLNEFWWTKMTVKPCFGNKRYEFIFPLR